MCTVIGAESAGLKDETAAQLGAHSWLFWFLSVVGIIGSFAINRMTRSAGAQSAAAPVSSP